MPPLLRATSAARGAQDASLFSVSQFNFERSDVALTQPPFSRLLAQRRAPTKVRSTSIHKEHSSLELDANAITFYDRQNEPPPARDQPNPSSLTHGAVEATPTSPNPFRAPSCASFVLVAVPVSPRVRRVCAASVPNGIVGV